MDLFQPLEVSVAVPGLEYRDGLLSALLQGDAHVQEHVRSYAFVITQNPQKQVLRADVVTVSDGRKARQSDDVGAFPRSVPRP